MVDKKLENALKVISNNGFVWDVVDGCLDVTGARGLIKDSIALSDAFEVLEQKIDDARFWDAGHMIPKPISDKQIKNMIWDSVTIGDETDKGGKASQSLRLIIGTLERDGQFKWHDVKTYGSKEEAYKGYTAYVAKQQKYSELDLKKVWKTGRLDIELLDGRKLLNWTGIFSRLAMGLDDDKEPKNPSKPAKEEKDKDKKEDK